MINNQNKKDCLLIFVLSFYEYFFKMANDRLIPSLFNTRNIFLFLIISWFFLVSLLPFSAYIFSERIPIIHPSIESTSNELVDIMKEEISSLKQQLVDLTRSTSAKIELTLNEALKIQTENYKSIQTMKTKQDHLSQIINLKNLEIEELRKTLNGIENQPKETCPIPRKYDNELDIIKNKIDVLQNSIPNPDEFSQNKQSLTAISSIIPKVNNLIRSSNQKLSNLKSQCESMIEEKNKPLIVEVNYQMIENYIKDSISNCQERFAESCPKVICPLPLPSISPSPISSSSTNKESAPSVNTISLLKPDPSENFDHALPASGAKVVLEETSKTFFPNQYRLDAIITQTMESLEIGYNYFDFFPPFSGQSILDFVGFDYGVGQVYEAVTPGTQLGNCWAIEVFHLFI